MKVKIRIKNLNAWYGKRHVLKNINLEIPEKNSYSNYWAKWWRKVNASEMHQQNA